MKYKHALPLFPAVLAVGMLRSQEPAQPVAVVQGPAVVAPQVVPGEYLVQHASGVSLTALRDAVYAKASADDVDRIVADLVQKVEQEREAFVRDVEALGGTVVQNYWIVEGSHVRLDASKVEGLRRIAGVVRVDPNWIHYPVLATSTNASNHNSDAANVTRGLTNNQLVVGTDLTVAILDTGLDAAMGSSGRPHRSFYKGGNPSNTTGAGISGSRMLGRFVAAGASGTGEDDNGHGSACASCSAGASWPGNDAGFAPDANIVGWKVSASSNGGASTSAIADGFQQTLANVTRYKIVAANNSYSGSPSMTEMAQQAADRCAYVGNVNVCVPAGNSSSNISATQAGYNALNAGSINKNSTTRSSFSGYGTQTTGKIIPDIAAIGASLNMTNKDSESTVLRASGTSFSSPSVAGAAVLVRHANPLVTALEAKALLLRNTRTGTMGSGLGSGVLQADLAVNAAIRGEFTSGKLSSTTPFADHSV
ncbi:MAG: S8 family serine peptidase, partial [Planctomycetes bacterium]|nr:S8 family serine peptidase [Planctomycetota bacterium]